MQKNVNKYEIYYNPSRKNVKLLNNKDETAKERE
jgi:hypothetical protein